MTPAQRTAAKLVSQHYKSLYYAIGREVVAIYFAGQTSQSLFALSRSSKKLRETVAAALTADPDAAGKFTPRGNLNTNTVTCLHVLEEAVEIAPLEGILLQVAADTLYVKLEYRITPASLREMIRRTSALHKLTVARGRVRLRSDLVVAALAARHAAERARTHLIRKEA